jgi:protocatechuate 3,4-dioxygenase beta subunit
MPRALLLLVALLALGAVVWLAWPTGTDTPGPGDDVVDRPEAPAQGPAPTILRGGEGASTIPVEHRGEGALLGRVLQGGEGRAADVSVHLLESFSGADPLGMWRGRSFLARILDGGVASGRALASVRSDADGRFTVAGLASGAYELRAVADDGSRARVTASIPAAGARVEALLELPQGGETLRGRVVYEDGTAFGGFVTVSSGTDMEAIIMTGAGAVVASIDREGRFVVGGLAPGPVVVSAVSPGRTRVIGAPVTLPRAKEYVLTLGGGSEVHRGRVLDDADGTPLEGASVTAGSGGPGIGFLLTRVFTDAEGRFELAVPAGDGGMFVEAEGYAPHTGGLTGTGGDTEVRLLRMARVTGRVLTKADPTGVEGAWVFAMPLERGFSLAFPAAVKTGASGRFEMPGIVPGAVTIFAMGGGWTSVGLGDVEPEGYNPLAQTLAPGEAREIELAVEPAGRLEGRVVTQAGRGVAGAVLALKSSFFAFRLTAQTALFGGGVGTTVADGDGRFVVDTLVPGVIYRVEATAVGSPPFVSDDLTVASGATAELEIVLEAARWLTLAVKSSDGTPLSGATIQAAVPRPDAAVADVAPHAVDTSWQRVTGEWRTDATGTARVGPLPPGPVGVRVEAAEHLEVRPWRAVGGGRTAGDLEDTVTLEKGLALGGTVQVPEGASPARVSISVRSRNPGSGRWVWEHTGPDAGGAWRVGGLPDGTYEVEAELAWQDLHWEATARVVAGDERVTLELVSTGSSAKGLVVKILGPDGEPVPGGNVRMHTRSENSSGSHGRNFSNGEATFEVDPEEEEVWIQAWARPGSGFGDAQIGPIPERSGEVVLRLPRARAIAGRVVTASGLGVGGVRVEAFLPSPISERYGGHGDHFALTDAEGKFELRDLGAGTYQVHVKAPPQYGPVPHRDVASGAQGVIFELDEAASAVVTVLDYEGRPVAGAAVGTSLDREEAEAAGIEAHARSVTTDGAGIARVGGLAPGFAYLLSVQCPEGRDDVRPSHVQDWTPGDVTVRLERAYVISGVVRDLAGRPVAEAWVQYGAEDDPGRWTGERTAEDGTFSIRNLSRGRYRVRVRVGTSLAMPMPGEPAEKDGHVLVDAGTRDLVLKVDPGVTLRILVKPWTGDEWGHAVVLREQREGGASFDHGQVDGNGRAEFCGCSPDKRYDLFVGGLPNGQYVLVRDLQVTGEELVLAPQTGGTIRGRLLLPSTGDLKSLQVSVRILGIQHGGQVQADGTFEIVGVPPGTWPVVAFARQGDGWLGGEVQAAPGATIEIRLASR